MTVKVNIDLPVHTSLWTGPDLVYPNRKISPRRP